MPATRLPAFQFYPADLQKDTGYKRCTKAERGAFIDFLCLVHECPFRGAAYDNGTAMTQDEVAGAIGGDRAENTQILSSLVAKGPIKVWSKVDSKAQLNTSREDLCPDLPDGTLYSRRMVRDEIKRIACSVAGMAGGGNPGLKSGQTFKGDPKGGSKGVGKGHPKGKRGSSSSSSSSSSDQINHVIPKGAKETFEAFRKAYPGKRRGLDVEFAHFQAKYKERTGEILPLLLPAAKAYAARCVLEGTEMKYRKHLQTWINNECWTEETPTAATGADLPRHQVEPASNLTDAELAGGHGN